MAPKCILRLVGASQRMDRMKLSSDPNAQSGCSKRKVGLKEVLARARRLLSRGGRTGAQSERRGVAISMYSHHLKRPTRAAPKGNLQIRQDLGHTHGSPLSTAILIIARTDGYHAGRCVQGLRLVSWRVHSRALLRLRLLSFASYLSHSLSSSRICFCGFCGAVPQRFGLSCLIHAWHSFAVRGFSGALNASF